MLKNRPNLKGAAFALLAFAFFATHDAVVKALGGTYSAFQIVFFSVLMGFPLVTLMLMRDTDAGTLRPRHPWWMALRTAAAVITGAAAFYAFAVLPLAQTYAILFASPLLITLLAIPVLGEKVGWRRGAAVIVGLIGVLVVLQPGSVPVSLGHIAALTAAVGGAVASVIVRKIGREERSVVLLLYPMVGNFVLMGALLPFVYRPMPVTDLGAVALIALLAFAAMLCLIAAYRSAEAAIVAPMQYSQILWATGFGALFFGETPDRNTAIGAAIIIASGLYIVFRESGGSASATTPVLRTRSRLGTPGALRVGPVIRAQDAAAEGRTEPLAKADR